MKHFFLFLCLLLILLASCAINDYQYLQTPQKISHVLTLPINYPVKKAVYSPRYNCLYLLNEQTNEIYIYKNKDLINKIGSSGFAESNFKKLSDICLSNDNYLLALDSFDRQIKKIDHNGQFVSSILLEEVKDPLLLDMSENGTLYVYDNYSKEIHVYDSNNLKPLFSFAKFQFQRLNSLCISANSVIAYDDLADISYFFEISGKLDKEFKGKVFRDKGMNQIILNGASLIFQNFNNNYTDPFFDADNVIIKEKQIIQISKGFIKIYEINY